MSSSLMTTFSPAPATLTGTPGEQLRLISLYLNTPARVLRDMRKLTDKQFVGDRILKGRVEAVGGLVEYEVGESIFADGLPEDIGELAEYPLVGVSEGEVKIEPVGLFGFRTRVSLQSVKRRNNQPVVKARTKLANSIVQQHDARVMAKINAAKPSMLQLVGSSWTTGGTILRQLLTATAMVKDQREGYDADAVLLDNTLWAILASDKDLQNAMSRESVDTPVYTGEMIRIAGLEILPAPTGQAPDPIVYDSTQLGSIVQETFGEARDDNGVEVAVAYHDAAAEATIANGWTIAAGRRASSIIEEPKAAVVITGTRV